MEDPGAEAFKKMLDEAQNKHAEKLAFSPTESENFKKAFDDPEFRKMFSEYVDELQNPANRAENEAYITQLEGEKKVPEGKELIRPKASFVAKTHKLDKDGKKTDEKVFINIVTSDIIAVPRKEKTKDGESWSLPYSLGPPHMEHDKNNSNVACFDCCFHPDVIKQMEANRRFQESLVMTAIEGIEEAYRRQKQSTLIAKEYHVLKGVTYKSGQISTMLVDSAAKRQQWNDKDIQTSTQAPLSTAKTTAVNNTNSSTVVTSGSGITSGSIKPKAVAEPAIKRGFLNNAKTTVYPESVSAKDKSAVKKLGSGPNILLPGHLSAQAESPSSPIASTDNRRSLVQELQPSEIREKKTSTSGPVTANGSDLAPATNATAAGFGGLMHERATTSKKIAPAATPAVETSQSLGSQVLSTGDNVLSSSSSSSSSSSKDATVTSDGNAAAASKRPGYSLVERGVVSMGDFESLRAKVTVNRPAELVCKLEVPLVVKASEMVLDVSERQLKLSYRDVYDFTTALPYPVFDKKGVAKYDKVAKTLTVTLPVQPHTKEELSALSPESKGNSLASGVSEVKQKGSDSGETVEVTNVSSSSNGNSSASSPTAASASSKPATNGEKQQQHSRWLHGSNADEVEEARRRSEDLAREVRESAEKAKAMAIASGGTAPVAAAASQPKPSTTTPPSPPCVADEDGVFMPCATFSGRRVGYVFKKGAKGVGYYLDTVVASDKAVKAEAIAQTTGTASSSQSQTQTSTSTQKQTAQKAATAVATPTTASVTVAVTKSDAPPLAFPFEYRQTPSSIAVLVQVPQIVADSVKVTFRATSVEVYFEATGSKSNGDDGGGSNNSNNIVTRYASKLVVHGGFLELPRCKYDVASKNMVLALAKREEGLWIDSVDQPIVCAEPLPIQQLDKATTGSGNAVSVSPKATLIKSMVSNENKKSDNQNLADQLNSMKLSSAPAVFDLD